MSKLQNSQNTIVFVDYVPAELHENDIWRIVYYVKNPFTEKLVRKRVRVKPHNSILQRRKLAKRMVLNINKRLEEGWNPFHQNKGTKEFSKFTEVLDIYIGRIKKDYTDENVRFDTYKTYNSQITLLKVYLENEVQDLDMMCFKFDQEFVLEYLDYVRYTKGLSAKTRDNYLSFIGTLSSWLLSKKYITVNPTQHISKSNKKDKVRVLIPEKTSLQIFEYWNNKNPHFLAICKMCYYCLIRRTELTKLKVADVNIENSTVWIEAGNSKNRKGNHVTIPDKLKPFLLEHLKEGANPNDYLFSSDNFKAGSIKLRPDRITRDWDKMRKKLKLDSKYQWYSLKDNGITDLLLAGVPPIMVRDQARHHSIKQTEAYTPKVLLKANNSIKTAKL